MQQGPEPCPLWLYGATPSALGPGFGSRLAESLQMMHLFILEKCVLHFFNLCAYVCYWSFVSIRMIIYKQVHVSLIAQLFWIVEKLGPLTSLKPHQLGRVIAIFGDSCCRFLFYKFPIRVGTSVIVLSQIISFFAWYGKSTNRE